MTIENGQVDWWIASDGNLYPPEQHPGYKPPPMSVPDLSSVGSPHPVRIGSGATFKTLRYGGLCVTCGNRIAKGADGWHDASVSKVSCAACPPAAVSLPATAVLQKRRQNPVGGTSALAVGQTRGDHFWVKGAAGEYLMAKSLQERLGDRAIILNDRAVPGSRANIDHVVVASSGVWIVDSKLWKGLIQVKTVGGFTSATQRLVVDGRDQSSHTEKIYSQVIPIANLLGDPSIPIRPALVFLDGNWGAGVSLRFLQNRPYELLGVMVTWPKALIANIDRAGPLSAAAVQAIASALDVALPPAR